MTVWAARPTTYKGIRMRSRLEARVAAELDVVPLPWTYEPRAFANERGQYLPDFEIPPSDGGVRTAYLEAKPTVEAAFLVMSRMQIIWDSDPEAELIIVLPGGLFFVASGAGDRRWRVDQWAWST